LRQVTSLQETGVSKIVSIHSFRGGTGKSNTVANLAALLAESGKRVGVIDTDILSPGIHVLFALEEGSLRYSLNDYLWGKCEIAQAAIDVTPGLGEDLPGRVFLIPSSIKAGEIARILREGYDVGLLNDGFRDLVNGLELDLLIIDTHPGLNEETLLSIAISDMLIILLRPDAQDYQGTSVTIEVARKLDVPQLALVVNKTPQVFDPVEVKDRVEGAYRCEVIAVLPHSDEMMTLASSGIFSLRHPDHPLTAQLRTIAGRLQD
jgi:MinD-like ATPase involved in chromosome partitioning or flagellar assembly